MTDHDLATLVRDHVQRDEPPFLMSPDTVIAVGRRTLVRRRARRGFAGVVVAAAAVAALPLMPWGGSGAGDTTGIDPATAAALENYDAQRMPALIDSHVRRALGHGLDGLGAPEFTAGDSQGNPLTPKDYDKASSMALAFGGTGDRRVRVELMHARSEAEGNARKNCANDLAAGYVLSCEVTTSDQGDTVRTDVMAVRKVEDFPNAAWGVITLEELRTRLAREGNASKEPVDPSKVFFIRSVESVHSETFLTRAEEIVRAPDLAAAEQRWLVPVADLVTIVTDPELVIPEPPTGDNGCAWTVPDSDVSCAVDPEPGHE
jgi:hypothetical protein